VHGEVGREQPVAARLTDPNTELTSAPRTIAAMTGTARPVRAARGHFARLVAVLAVFAGLAVAVGMQCTDGMAVMPMAHGADSAPMACGSPASTATAHERVAPADNGPLTVACAAPGVAAAYAESEAPGTGGLGGLLATCLAFLVAVVTLVASLRSAGLRSVPVMVGSARVRLIRTLRPRAPSLAELCLLRM
jgi:hypothetical protein